MKDSTNQENNHPVEGMSERVEGLMRTFYAERDHLRGYVYAATQNYHAMEDLLQEMAITVVQKADSFDSDRDPLPWFMGIARIHIMRWYEKQGREKKIFRFELLENSDVFAKTFSSSEVAPRERALMKCLEKLPKKQRRIIALRYNERMKCATIAEQFGITVKGIYAVLNRVKDRLRKCVEYRVDQGISA